MRESSQECSHISAAAVKVLVRPTRDGTWTTAAVHAPGQQQQCMQAPGQQQQCMHTEALLRALMHAACDGFCGSSLCCHLSTSLLGCPSLLFNPHHPMTPPRTPPTSPSASQPLHHPICHTISPPPPLPHNIFPPPHLPPKPPHASAALNLSTPVCQHMPLGSTTLQQLWVPRHDQWGLPCCSSCGYQGTISRVCHTAAAVISGHKQ